ncbi:ATP-binding protein [Slackia heliotrinireducens]|uniref:ATP-binding protein n=1 Tax=Slackia heliotrinireducens TaxID=84110 RepID=UPI003314E04F
MLRRKMLDYLRRWRQEKEKECLLIKGARQVGKSFIVEEFGKSDYTSFVMVDFIKTPEFKGAFQGSLDPDDIYSRLSLLMPGAQYVEGNTLIFLDEIQECPQARSALKYLAQDRRYDVVASGSLLGIQYRQNAEQPSIPVGYERAVDMHPLDFEEFLWARGYDDHAIEALRGYFDRLEPVPQVIHQKMMRLLREYLAIGGMPAVVQSFVDTGNFNAVHDEQRKLLDSYLDDIAKYATPTERVKARACFMSLPRQLAKENTKFQYAIVEKRGTARKFDGSVDWLVGANIVLKCQSVSAMMYPLAAYEDASRFRLYANDTGLLMAMYDYDMKAAVVNNTLKGPMKGGLYENLVGSMLAQNGVALRYWMSQSGNREIEFLGESGATVEPIEVKASRGSTVSLNDALKDESVARGYKLIDGNVGVDGKKVTLPLYMATFLYRSR